MYQNSGSSPIPLPLQGLTEIPCCFFLFAVDTWWSDMVTAPKGVLSVRPMASPKHIPGLAGMEFWTLRPGRGLKFAWFTTELSQQKNELGAPTASRKKAMFGS